MYDLISRQAAIDAIEKLAKKHFDHPVIMRNVKGAIENLSSAKSERNEWCTDCKEYDQEAHCCHRYSSVIKEAVDELQVIRCKDCKAYDSHDKRCKVWNHGVAEYEYCYRGCEE